MPARQTKTKRPVGRPRLGPKHIDELRMKALEGMDRSRVRYEGESSIPLDQLKQKVNDLSTRKKYSGQEIKELRETVAEMYEHHLDTLVAEEAQQNKELNEALRCVHVDVGIKSSGKTLTEKEWFALHGRRHDGTKPRGPKPKKKKTVWELAPGEKGMGTEPAEPIDFEQIEREYEKEMFEREIQRQKDLPAFAVGKRLRKDHQTPRPRVDQSRFYY